ncbi:MAG: 3'-5' exonuclease [Oscillospiraceae bacterium]
MNDMIQQFLKLRKQYIENAFGRLNPVQKQAVFTTDGPLLILAGAGSGKTTVLVNRIANLVRFGSAYNSDKTPREITKDDISELEAAIKDKSVPSERLLPLLSERTVRPWNILAITFTNKAAGELKTRLSDILGEQGADINASTFHSACVRILRREAGCLGFPQSFTIYDSDDQQRAMKEVFKQLNIDDKFLPVKAAISAMGRLKDKMISPATALRAPADSRDGLVARAYEAYQARLVKAGAFDFDDLIYYTVKLLEDNDSVREAYQARFKYVLVDEYQDTSIAQFRLVNLLTGPAQNICVVGDDDQSIYRFRGATIENILSFESNFNNATVIRLEQNYRSTSNILNAANCVIKNNEGRKGKTLWTENGEGDKILHYDAENENEEAAHVAQIIGANLKKGAKLREHAILYRMNAQSGPIETYFARAGVPYKIVGGQRFYDRKEIKDLIAYMSIVANSKDDLRLKRIINEPSRKIGAATLENLTGIATEQGTSMLDIMAHVQDYPALQRSSSALASFYSMYERLVAASEELSMDAFVSELIDLTGYRAMLEAQKEEGQTRLENVGQLVSSVKAYADERQDEATLSGYLEEVALISDIDSYDEGADVVVMMTMHAAKGLEFDYVFLVGLEEGIFPSEMCRYSNEDLEEERRLCYVGITRARKELYLSSAASRMIFGQTKHNRSSRFLEEIDKNLIEEKVNPVLVAAKAARARYQEKRSAPRAPQPVYTSRSTLAAGGGTGVLAMPTVAAEGKGKTEASKPKTTFKSGEFVNHKVFGRGEVLSVTPVAGDTIVEIKFDTAGIKKTMANYAPLSHISE